MNRRPTKLNKGKRLTEADLDFYKCLFCELYPMFASQGISAIGARHITHEYAMHGVKQLRKVKSK